MQLELYTLTSSVGLRQMSSSGGHSHAEPRYGGPKPSGVEELQAQLPQEHSPLPARMEIHTCRISAKCNIIMLYMHIHYTHCIAGVLQLLIVHIDI